jgi:hypothetical protein
MPSREAAKPTGQSPLVFRMRQTVRLFLSCRDTAIIASPQTTEGFDAKDSVGAGDVRRAWGSLLVRFCRVGDPFRRRGPITPRLKKLPVAGLARVAHGGGPGSAVLTGAGALLAAAVIGTAPGGISRLFSTLVLGLQS